MDNKQIASVSQKYYRYKNLISGIVFGFVIMVVLPVLVKKYLVPTEGSITLVLVILIGFGAIVIVTTIAGFIRSGKQKFTDQTQDGKPAFHSSAGNTAIYKETKADTNVVVAENEIVQVYYAPVMRSLTADTGLAGQVTLTGEENCLILTNNQLIGILLAPADMEKYGTQNKVSALLDMLPSDPGGGNISNTYFNNQGMYKTIKLMLQNESLQNIASGHYAISIPRSEIIRVQVKSFGGLTFETNTLGTFHWHTVKTADMKKLLEDFGTAGLPCIVD